MSASMEEWSRCVRSVKDGLETNRYRNAKEIEQGIRSCEDWLVVPHTLSLLGLAPKPSLLIATLSLDPSSN